MSWIQLSQIYIIYNNYYIYWFCPLCIIDKLANGCVQIFTRFGTGGGKLFIVDFTVEL